MSAYLGAEEITVAYGARTVVTDLSLEVDPTTVTALIGPNGSGKSTLLRTLARLIRPRSGTIYLDGKAIAHLSTAEIARRMAILPQGPSTPGELTVRELVEQGRYPHVGPLRMLRRQDHEAIDTALALTGMESFTERGIDELSGGERQRAWIALALAQDTSVLLLDEPTTFLDVRYQLEVLELVRRLHEDRGLTIVLALHDLNHAARYAGSIVALKDGRIVAKGSPAEVLSAELLASVFGVRATILSDPRTGAPVCLPYAVSAP